MSQWHCRGLPAAALHAAAAPFLGACAFLPVDAVAAAGPAPIAPNHRNPRYFTFRGNAVALISSGEHYGALINLDFDYHAYIAALAHDNFTLTQVFAGSYVEPDSDVNSPPGSNPGGNTLSPLNGSFIAPWRRTDVPGAAKGGAKFDLTQYNQTYFDRLQDFVAVAGAAGIVVEIVLFCGYEVQHEFIWAVSPLNPSNNVNGWTDVNRTNAYTLRAPAPFVAAELEMARRVTAALRPYDNAFVEVIFMNGDPDWGAAVAGAVAGADARRLIAAPAEWALPEAAAATVRNATAAAPPRVASIADSWGLGGQDGGAPLPVYRSAYWRWMLRGGGAVYNCDWSFAVGHEGGSKVDNQTQSSPSGAEFRMMVRSLGAFFRRLSLVDLDPRADWLQVSATSRLAALAPARTAVSPAGQYAAYIDSTNGTVATEVRMRLGAKASSTPCTVEWVDPQSGVSLHTSSVQPQQWQSVRVPKYSTDIACLAVC